ncbi:Isopenicillin N epimerase component-like protein [Emericellopsis cladophorae]|uniref:Isopenicillin N epimerase component-like protein n=1 Tax=Emericellopsis cladophorae TaxID=2686198 RepID=A0A9P9Y3S0_9HYPO|nr:Isopenicillin N epimerase component-like protein [Emericellopsis cladophorae]KAI6782952.1 Isopenicillin N epimerase component-like protein [Emericellopsis cladophorae]
MASTPPLTGIKVLEFAGLAPGPFAGMLLADAGASVLRIDRAIPDKTHHPSHPPPPTGDLLVRHKTSVAVNLKDPAGVALVKRLAAQSDVLIDPFRPGVLEKLGLGPDVLLALHPGLIYGRMTGFRRDGRYKDMAGHDINYLAVSGALDLLGRDGEKPHPPWNILADFAGGGAMLFQGVLLALAARHASGRGQVVEANMVDGASYLATFPRMALKTPFGDKGRGRNMLDGGCPWYDTYETKDGGYMSVGALEPHFFAILMKGLGLDGQGWEESRVDESRWPELKALYERTFRSKTRREWEDIFDGTDACCTPVLGYHELETQSGREGDQRPAVTLRGTPCLAVHQASDPSGARGQGNGVQGDGYTGFALGAGEGGEETLKQWAGWVRGREYDVEKGGLVLKDKARL